ncbi:efflux RND transporter periplasmic adaptor subunit [Massilia solisilvae]|uniref:Efflux RND transporter periplasmic adaptor subunit n=1 Tax=Massilia solisilvae TaxID=1811225 RepID=A0ABT2BRE6_9BURK|nr:efflux RND transporter periplasmic adaptor subunit [Massilia solisilvae]MCS0611083.1 efflux RND transporter periplasmic adaptor subunit [Massilia solisilvae]
MSSHQNGRSRALRIAAMLSMLAGAAQAASVQAPAPRAADRPALEKQDIRAQLAPRRYTTIAAEIGAKISRIGVPEGASFRAGQTLVALDCSIQQAQLQKARAVLAAAEKTYAANKRLDELNSVGKVELQVSEAEVSKAKADVASTSVVLSKCVIPAPFAGRVAEQKAREQQYVQPGQPLLDILDDSVLELEFIVPSRWLAWLKPGYAFQVHIDETNKTYSAKVQRIGAKVDPVSQSVKLSAAISGRFPELIAGMSGRVALQPPSTQ